MNVFEYVFAYELEDSTKGIVRADSKEEAMERIVDKYGCENDQVKTILALEELDNDYGIVDESKMDNALKTYGKPYISQMSFDIQIEYGEKTTLDDVREILEDNGINVVGASDEYGWTYDEYWH